VIAVYVVVNRGPALVVAPKSWNVNTREPPRRAARALRIIGDEIGESRRVLRSGLSSRVSVAVCTLARSTLASTHRLWDSCGIERYVWISLLIMRYNALQRADCRSAFNYFTSKQDEREREREGAGTASYRANHAQQSRFSYLQKLLTRRTVPIVLARQNAEVHFFPSILSFSSQVRALTRRKLQSYRSGAGLAGRRDAAGKV